VSESQGKGYGVPAPRSQLVSGDVGMRPVGYLQCFDTNGNRKGNQPVKSLLQKFSLKVLFLGVQPSLEQLQKEAGLTKDEYVCACFSVGLSSNMVTVVDSCQSK